jgi:exonuclease III
MSNITNYNHSFHNSSSSTQTKNITNLLNITTLNVQGLNNRSKLFSLTNQLTNSRSILCCTETKNTKTNPLPKNLYNCSIISSLHSVSAKNGTCIILGSDIKAHIYQTFTINEYWCSVHLKFKPKVNIILTAIYLPHDKTERHIATKSLITHLKSFKTSFHQILTGDFNTYPKLTPSINAPTSHSKRSIYNTLHSWIDIAKACKKERDYTHYTHNSASRIDQTWITQDLAEHVLDFKTHTNTAISTDHKQIQVIFNWFEYKIKKSFISTKTYDFFKATDSQIKDFQEELDLKIFNEPINNWNKWY